MANRTGIELLPDVCRVVEVQDAGGWLGLGRGKAGASRVKSFHEIPYSPDRPGACAVELRRLLGAGGRDVRLVVWGLRATHQVLYLPQADRAELDQMARREARPAAGGAAPAAMAGSVMVGDHREAGRIEVGYVSLTAAEVQGRTQAFTAAGLDVSAVATPAVAHAHLVRQRWGQFSETATAVLAVNARATAMTVVRGGVVLFAREMPWGHRTERADRGTAFDASAFAGQLASELRRSLVFLKQQSKVDVGHILVCGDLPDLRALTGPLMHELSVEVETLDSLDGLDVARLPEPADEFRSRIGALRPAWAAAAEPSASVNLVPRDTSAMRFAPKVERRHGVAVVAGLLIALGAWGAVTWLAESATAEQERLRRRIALLEPQMQRRGELRREVEIQAARLAALRAFATEGPRMARVLEILGKAAPPDIALTEVTFEPAIGAWALTVAGQAEGKNAAEAQVAFGQFLAALKGSPLLGEFVNPPAISVTTTDPVVKEAVSAAESNAPFARSAQQPIEERRRQSYQGPAFIEIARNGLTYRIPLSPNVDVLRDYERKRELVIGPGDFAGGRVSTPQAPAAPVDPLKRTPPSLLEFTLEFEVRK